MHSSNTDLPITSTRVLVVDDESSVRLALTRYLNLLGFRATAAASGYQALEMLKREPYDAMVLDIRMPGMDGIEVMRQAHQRYPHLCIVLLTGHASLESAIAAVRSHADDYLIKPAGGRDIATAIARALQDRVPQSPPRDTVPERFVRAGPLILDRERHTVFVARSDDADRIAVPLTTSESKLLDHLMQRPDTVFCCRELAQAALGYELGDDEAQAIVRPHISRLRKKIEPDPSLPRLIRTVPGKGYYLAAG